jgi:hypothetical protein
MSSSPYLNTLEAIEDEISRLLEKRTRIDQRLTQLKTTADSLRSLLDVPTREEGLDVQIDRTVSDLGITNAIKKVLFSSKIPLSAPEIKSGLESIGVDLSNYANAGAVIHNTLTRLEKQRQVVRVQNPAGQTVAYTLDSMYKRLFEL